MKLHRFENVNPAHYSHAIFRRLTNEIILTATQRDIEIYTGYAFMDMAQITTPILTHAHKDFAGGQPKLQQSTAASLLCPQSNSDCYRIIDIRDAADAASNCFFSNALNILLYQLRERIAEIPNSSPIETHCSDGYRSAIRGGILAGGDYVLYVYEFGPDVELFMLNIIRNSVILKHNFNNNQQNRH